MRDAERTAQNEHLDGNDGSLTKHDERSAVHCADKEERKVERRIGCDVHEQHGNDRMKTTLPRAAEHQRTERQLDRQCEPERTERQLDRQCEPERTERQLDRQCEPERTEERRRNSARHYSFSVHAASPCVGSALSAVTATAAAASSVSTAAAIFAAVMGRAARETI